MGLGRVAKLGALLGLELILLSNLACGNNVQEPKSNSTSTRPAATATYTPSPTATPFLTPTPTPVYQEVQGINVPTNVYLEGDACIPFELQGVEKCVNMFVYGESPTVPYTWKGIVHVIGDVIIDRLTIEPGAEVYVAANSDINNLAGGGEAWESAGINTTNEIMNGIHPGEPFYDEPNHINISGNTININGTKENPVLITSSAEEPTRYDWSVLSFNNESIINYAVIEYGRIIHPGNNSVISNSILRHLGACLCLGGSLANVKIINNQIYDTGHELIDIHHSTVYIEGNDLGPNLTYDPNIKGNVGGRGIILDLSKGGQVEIYDNIFHDINFAAILLIKSAPEIPFILEGNTFYNNKKDIFCPSTPEYCNDNKAYFLENNKIEHPNFINR